MQKGSDISIAVGSVKISAIEAGRTDLLLAHTVEWENGHVMDD